MRSTASVSSGKMVKGFEQKGRVARPAPKHKREEEKK